jgi:hypothetical protein
MAINYTILKSSFIHSSIWMEDSDTRIVWVAFLAMRNKDGEVFSSVIGMAHAARVDFEKTKAAIEKFCAPDSYSNTTEHEGRRLVAIPGGWRLLNHEKVKAEAQAANKANYMAGYMKDRRDHEKRAKSLPVVGEQEYMVALRRGVSESELDAIVSKHLQKQSP